MAGSAKVLKLGLVGANIQRTRLPGGLEVLCAQEGKALDFTLHDSSLEERFDFDTCLAACAANGYRGVAVTHPFKPSAFYRADRVEAMPGTLGACNCLRFDPDGWSGSNTDFSGFLKAWGMHMGDLVPGRVVMAGAGGVARSLAAGLRALGAELVEIFDLDARKAVDVATGADPSGEIIRPIDLSVAGASARSANGLVNATPLGMAEYPGMAFRREDIGGQSWVFDAVYTPIETEFMRAARDAGLRRLTGFHLFLHMAMDLFEFFSSTRLDRPRAMPKLEKLAPED